jgi:hypothetical protein
LALADGPLKVPIGKDQLRSARLSGFFQHAG